MRKGSNFVFQSVDFLSYHIHKASLRRENSYIKSSEWILNKKAAINSKNKLGNNKCFEYSIIVALHHQDFKNHPERISNMHEFFLVIIIGKVKSFQLE